MSKLGEQKHVVERLEQASEDQKEIRGKVGEDHCSDRADPRGQPGGDKLGESSYQGCAEKDRSCHLRRELKAAVQPQHQKRLHDEAAPERIEAEKCRELEDD